MGTSEPQEPPETDSNAEKLAKEVIKECNIQEILNESKYLFFPPTSYPKISSRGLTCLPHQGSYKRVF